MLAGCSDDSTGPGTATPHPQITAGSPVSGELTANDQVHTRVLRADHRKVGVRLRSQTEGVTFKLELEDSVTGRRLVSVSSDAPASDWVGLTVGRSYLVHTRLATSNGGGGRYQIDLVPQAIDVVVGDTIHGALLTPSVDQIDEDVYHFQGEAGQEIIIFVEALTKPTNLALRIVVPDGDEHDPLAWATSAGGSGVLEERSSGRLRLPVDGTYEIIVGGWKTPYRFLVSEVDRRPETASRTIAVGDTVSGEGIDAVGDIDEFVFSGTAGMDLNVFFRIDEGLSGDVFLTVLRGEVPLAHLMTNQALGELEAVRTGRFALPASDEYKIRVEGRSAGIPERDTGRYTFEIAEIDRRPESVSERVEIGTLVEGESIDRPADIDEFSFHADAGMELNVLFFNDAIGDDQLRLEVIGPRGSITSIHGGSTIRFSVAASGLHHIRVASLLPESGHVGPYSFLINRVRREPESLSPRIYLDQIVTGEAIDIAGDIDEFVMHGRRGQEVNVFARMLPGAKGGLDIRFEGGGRFTSVGDACADLYACHISGTFLLPLEGDNKVVVSGDVENGPGSVGPYEFTVYPIDRAPEHVSASIEIGDTIRGERIDRPGDIDEFVFQGNEGERLGLYLSSPNVGLVLVVEEDGTGQWIRGIAADSVDPTDGHFVLPLTGMYRIRVQHGNPFQNSPDGVGEYEFAVYRR
jgi:hypothetical protein